MRNCKYQVQDTEYGWRNCEHRTEGNLEYCASHARTIRKAEETAKRDSEKLAVKLLKQKEKQSEPRKMPNKVSDKQKVKDAEYNARVKVWKVENPKCKALVSPDCTGETRDCHHMKKRGDLLMVEKYWLPVCGFCHDWIGRNSDEARQRGLTINHLEPEFIEPHKI